MRDSALALDFFFATGLLLLIALMVAERKALKPKVAVV